MNNFLELKHITKSYNNKLILKDISFKINNNEILAIVGKSGCGKSTLLSIIAGLTKNDGGKVLTYQPLNYGYMLQTDTLLPWLSIKDNCLLGLKLQKGITKDKEVLLNDLLDKYHLMDYQDKYPSSLSGGMKERVALIRTILLDPSLLLLDEPMSSLDYQTKRIIGNDLYNLIKDYQKSAIIVTHDLDEAVSLADKVIILSDKPSTIIKEVIINHHNLNYNDFRKSEYFLNYVNEIWEYLNET